MKSHFKYISTILEPKDITLFAILATLPDSQHSINPDTWSYSSTSFQHLNHRWQHYNTKHNTRSKFMLLKKKKGHIIHDSVITCMHV